MNQPKISVIVPVYKVEDYLRACVDSLVAQCYENLEIILVDDGSPDRCGAICDEYAARDSRIQVIHQENAGLSAARNAGIKRATGEFLCFVDSDDTVHPRYVAALYDACARTGAEIAVCRFSDNAEGLEWHGAAPAVYTPREISMELCMDSTGVLGVTWNKMYAARLFENIFFPPGRIHEDEATTYRLFWESRSCALMTDVLYHYRTRESSIVHSGFTQRRMDAALAYRERIEFYNCHSEPELADYTKAVYCHFLRSYRQEIRTNTRDPGHWMREMRAAFAGVLRSSRVTLKKKLSLSLQMLSPGGYRRCKEQYHRLTGRNGTGKGVMMCCLTKPEDRCS